VGVHGFLDDDADPQRHGHAVHGARDVLTVKWRSQTAPIYRFSGTGTLTGLIGGLVPHNVMSLTER
jgi:hypothetical protein